MNTQHVFNAPGGMGAAQLAANRLYDLIVAHGLVAGVAVSWDGPTETVTISCMPRLWPTVETLAQQVGLQAV